MSIMTRLTERHGVWKVGVCAPTAGVVGARLVGAGSAGEGRGSSRWRPRACRLVRAPGGAPIAERRLCRACRNLFGSGRTIDCGLTPFLPPVARHLTTAGPRRQDRRRLADREARCGGRQRRRPSAWAGPMLAADSIGLGHPRRRVGSGAVEAALACSTVCERTRPARHSKRMLWNAASRSCVAEGAGEAGVEAAFPPHAQRLSSATIAPLLRLQHGKGRT